MWSPSSSSGGCARARLPVGIGSWGPPASAWLGPSLGPPAGRSCRLWAVPVAAPISCAELRPPDSDSSVPLPCPVPHQASPPRPLAVPTRNPLPAQASHCASSLRQHYSKLLLQYELVQRVRAPATALTEPAPADASAVASGSLCGPSDAAAGGGGGTSAGAGGGVCGGVSCLTLALQLQDMEERIPWSMVRDASTGCDWAVVRPIWLTAVRRLPAPLLHPHPSTPSRCPRPSGGLPAAPPAEPTLRTARTSRCPHPSPAADRVALLCH